MITDLPLEAHLIVAAFTMAGLVFWIWGRKFLKPGFVVFGVLAGAAVGYLATVGFGFPFSPIIPSVLLGALGMLFGWMAFRFAVAGAMGLVFTIAAPLIAVPILLGSVPEDAPKKGPLSIQELLQDDIPILNGEVVSGAQKLVETLNAPKIIEDAGGEVAAAADEQIRAFVKQLFREAEAEWLILPMTMRLGMLGGGLLAFATGFGLGMLMPKYASGLLASSVGAAVWLPGSVWLLQAMNVDVGKVAPQSTIVWVCLWLVLAVIGAFFQWRKKKKRADKEVSESTS